MEVLVKYDNGTRFTASCDGYTVTTGHGDDGDSSRNGMWPVQLFLASLGMCIGGYVLAYCKDNGIPCDDMTLEIHRTTARLPSRTTKVDVRIHIGAELPEKQAAAVLRAADRCHITNIIEHQMEVACSLDGSNTT